MHILLTIYDREIARKFRNLCGRRPGVVPWLFHRLSHPGLLHLRCKTSAILRADRLKDSRMSLMISLLFAAALTLTIALLIDTGRSYGPLFKALRQSLALPEAAGEVSVTVYPEPSLHPVARPVARLRKFVRRLGRHHDPKPVTHRLHRFDKSFA